MEEIKIFKGNIIFTKVPDAFETIENGYIIVCSGKVMGIYAFLPKEFENIEIIDYSNKLIIPSFVDLHLHGPQFENTGLGMDKELLPWLETYTFPEESKYKDVEYAKKVYPNFIKELWKNGTTRCVVYGTIHRESTEFLADLFIENGFGAYVGKVNMDRNSPDILVESTDESLLNTEMFLKRYYNSSDRVKPIITPRFVPTCSEDLMLGLSDLAKKYDVPVQSHLSENRGEIAWVKDLHPDCKNYSSVYDKYGLFGGEIKTVMAHCVHLDEDEIELLKNRGVFVAHCPTSNLNVYSGIAPIKRYMSLGIDVGIGSDISGGHTLSILECMVSAIQSSKMYHVYIDDKYGMLSTSEAFYLATKGGGKFFGRVGSFEEGYDFDALVIDDSSIYSVLDKNIVQRLEKFIYSGNTSCIVKRYAFGKPLELKS